MTAIENARDVLAAFYAAPMRANAWAELADTLRDLIAEHERLTTQVEDQREALSTQSASLTQAVLNVERLRKANARLSAPPTDDTRETIAQAGLDSERLRQLAEWLSMEHGHEETAKRVSLIADRHDFLASDVWRNRHQEPIAEAQVEAAARALHHRVYGFPLEADTEHAQGLYRADAHAALEAARNAS